MPAEAAAGIIRAHAAFVTRPEPVTGTIRKLTGHPARTFANGHATTRPTSGRNGPNWHTPRG
jgi:hypothetical protein